MRPLFILMLSLLLAHCAYKPEDAGLCKLNCSDAIIGGADPNMVIELKSKVSAITCSVASQGQPLADPLLVQFVAAERYDVGQASEGKRPVPNLSFEPIVNGLRSELEVHNPNVTIENGVFTPARYKGIVTPKSNWCTDSCGVATLEVFAVCPPPGQSGEVGIQIHTGALYSEEIANFTISTEDDE